MADPAYLYKEHAKTRAPDDFWGQVKRTVNGKPVAQEQIDMIVTAMLAALDLDPGERLLDLCCGNGALTTYFFARCQGGLGVDYSEFLIDVAQKNFVRRPSESYVLSDAVAFVANTANVAFDKALCYGAFQYLDGAAALLRDLRQRFPAIRRFVIGNLPDKALMHRFFATGVPTDGSETRADTPIGIWRTREEFATLAAGAGWNATFRTMPAEFYAAHYRYDAVLTPA